MHLGGQSLKLLCWVLKTIHIFLFPNDCIYIPTTHFRFTNIVCKYVGATHDAYIIANSFLKEWPSCKVGDGFRGQRLLPSPMADDSFSHAPSEQQMRYNASHIKTRNRVERDFGVFKSRFRQV